MSLEYFLEHYLPIPYSFHWQSIECESKYVPLPRVPSVSQVINDVFTPFYCTIRSLCSPSNPNRKNCKWFVPPFCNTLTNSSQAVFYTNRRCGSSAPFCTTRISDRPRRSTDRNICFVCCVGERNRCEIVQYPQLVVHTDISENITAVICEVLNQLYKYASCARLRVGTWKATRIYFFRWISTAVVGFLLGVFVRIGFNSFLDSSFGCLSSIGAGY